MSLLNTLLTEPLSKDVGHGLWWESDGEGEVLVVAGHGSNVLHIEVSRCGKASWSETYQVLGNIDLHRLVRKAEDRGNFTHTIGTVVEEEQGIVI